jgi:hypothetical protein
MTHLVKKRDQILRSLRFRVTPGMVGSPPFQGYYKESDSYYLFIYARFEEVWKCVRRFNTLRWRDRTDVADRELWFSNSRDSSFLDCYYDLVPWFFTFGQSGQAALQGKKDLQAWYLPGEVVELYNVCKYGAQGMC